MKIILNGDEIILDAGASISDLLDKYSIDSRKIAIEKNMEIVPSSNFEETKLNDGDKLEIIHFIGGG